MRIIARGVDNLPFGVSRTFRSRLIGQHVSDVSHDLATLTFNVGGHGGFTDIGLRVPSMYQFEVCRPSRSKDMTHFLSHH